MKKIILVAMLISNLLALDSVSSIPEEQKKIVSRIIEVLQLPVNEKVKEAVYEKLRFSFKEGWSAHWTTNLTGTGTKIKNSDTQICDVSIYNNNRVVNCTFVYFKKEKQLFTTVKEYVEAESSAVLEKYKQLKNNPKYSIENETDNYAYFQEKGYMNYERDILFEITALRIKALSDKISNEKRVVIKNQIS